MEIVGQSTARAKARIWIGAGAVYGVAAFAPALDGGRAPGDAAWSVVPFCAAFALAFVPWGRWADRHGAAAAMRWAALGLLVAGVPLLLPLGDTGWVAGRALEGAAAAGFPPAAQAALAALGGARGAGRAIGEMSIAVAVGTLLLPLVAGLGESAIGSTAVLAVGAIGLPLLALAAVRPLGQDGGGTKARTLPGPAAVSDHEAALVLTPGILAAWACAFLVLLAYWTVVTRAASLLGPGGAGLGEDAARAVPLAGGVAGIVLTGLVAGVADRRGPRAPMVAVLLTGAAGLVLAAAAGTATAAAAGVAGFVTAYWCYLTLVGVQVVRSAPARTHGRALGGLYASMWTGAAVGGGLATLSGSWIAVLSVCAIAWLTAAGVAARWFLGGMRTAAGRSRAVPPRSAALSALDVGPRAR
jgi:hypothetical protein